MPSRASFLLAAALGLGVTLPAQAETAGADKTLTVVVGGAFTSMDPQFFNLGPNNALTTYVFEPLVRFNATYRPEPALAVSWKAIDERTWEFKLRQGVTFHDGSPFTADDVVFSYARAPVVPNSPSSFNFAVKPIIQTEVVDAHTVRFRTAEPVPLMPYNLTSVAIVEKKRGDGMTTATFNSLATAVGTGPYKVTAFTLGDRARFERNDAWWDKKPIWTSVIYRMVTDDAARIATLRAGEADVIDQVPTRDVAGLKGNPKLTVIARPGQRLIYLAPDASRPTSPFVTDLEGKPLDVNPLRDPRVRRAFSLAINREGLKDRIMDGYAAPTGQLMPQGISGYEPAIPVDPYDPERAKKLLADAGFPAGFGITLHGPNNRYVNDQKLVEAIAQMFTRIGIKTTVDTMPAATFFSRAVKSEFSIRLTGWASDTGEASSNLTQLIASSNPAKGRDPVFQPDKYANPKVDTIVEQSLATIDTDKRETLYREAERLALPDLPIIPIHHQVNVWAVRKGLNFQPRMLERTYAWDIVPE